MFSIPSFEVTMLSTLLRMRIPSIFIELGELIGRLTGTPNLTLILSEPGLQYGGVRAQEGPLLDQTPEETGSTAQVGAADLCVLMAELKPGIFSKVCYEGWGSHPS